MIRTCAKCTGEFETDNPRAHMCPVCRRPKRTKGERIKIRGENAKGPLTPRQLQIVKLASEGCANKEIGNRLHLSEGTIKEYLHHAFKRAGVSNRTELVRFVLKEGGEVKPAIVSPNRANRGGEIPEWLL